MTEKIVILKLPESQAFIVGELAGMLLEELKEKEENIKNLIKNLNGSIYEEPAKIEHSYTQPIAKKTVVNKNLRKSGIPNKRKGVLQVITQILKTSNSPLTSMQTTAAVAKVFEISGKKRLQRLNGTVSTILFNYTEGKYKGTFERVTNDKGIFIYTLKTNDNETS